MMDMDDAGDEPLAQGLFMVGFWLAMRLLSRCQVVLLSCGQDPAFCAVKLAAHAATFPEGGLS